MKRLSLLSIILLAVLSPLACSKQFTLAPVPPPLPTITPTPTQTAQPTATPTPTPPSCNGGVVSSFTGQAGVPGSINGSISAATFTVPTDLAEDSSGNFYITDEGNELIRKVSGGVVSTLAGSGGQGFANGTGTAASFSLPWGIAVDSNGNVYVGDQGNTQIRIITPGGVVSTFAGSTTPGSLNGTLANAEFEAPSGIAIDSSGNLYVTDYGNEAIRKISGGMVSTLAGSKPAGFVNGTGTAASFNLPLGICVDSSGNVYVADFNNNAIRKITPGGVVTTLAGTGAVGSANGPGATATFDGPAGVAVDNAGYVYVTDNSTNLIRMISPGGVVSTLAGSGAAGFANGTGTAASFEEPVGILIDANCHIYVADHGNDMIREIQ